MIYLIKTIISYPKSERLRIESGKSRTKKIMEKVTTGGKRKEKKKINTF